VAFEELRQFAAGDARNRTLWPGTLREIVAIGGKVELVTTTLGFEAKQQLLAGYFPRAPSRPTCRYQRAVGGEEPRRTGPPV
jgi:hypothetical protein